VSVLAVSTLMIQISSWSPASTRRPWLLGSSVGQPPEVPHGRAAHRASEQPARPHRVAPQTLYLSSADISAKTCSRSCASPAALLPDLRHLELINTNLGGSARERLADAPLPSLRRLDVRRNDLPESSPRTRESRSD
jgi:hypothetical protein